MRQEHWIGLVNMNKQVGIGLLEVFISLFLASFIIVILLNQYIHVKRHYLAFQSTLNQAMDLQVVIDLLQNSIRQAGFTPCMRIDHLTTLDTSGGRQSILAIDIENGLTINRMSPHFNVLLNRMHSNQIETTASYEFHEKDTLIIADCYHAEIVHLTDVTQRLTSQRLTLDRPLSFNYQPPVYVGEWWQENYFVRPSKGLFYQRERTDELTSLVKNISIEMKHNWIELALILKQGLPIKIDTRVRAV